MHMTTPHDIGLEQEGPNGDGAMFNRKTADKADAITKVASGKMAVTHEDSEASEDADSGSESESDADGDRLDRELDSLYESYQQRKEDSDAKQRAKRARKQKQEDEFEGFSASEAGDPSDNETDGETILPLRPATAPEGLSTRAAMFFDQHIFQDLGISDMVAGDDSAIEMDDEEEEVKDDPPAQDQDKTTNKTSNMWQKKSKTPHTIDVLSSGSDSGGVPAKSKRHELDTENAEFNSNDIQVEKATESSLNDDPRNKKGQLDIEIITAEAMALAHSIATGEKTRADLNDDSFNKYTFRDVDGLPDWFLDDEGQHSRPQRPMTAAAAAAIREKLRALNARPIKKVREARGRKKFRAAQRLEKLRKKSALLLDEEGLTEKDKASTIARLMGRAAKKKPRQKVQVVVASGGNRGIAGRPRGVKGRYKIVDARLKKDVRAEKRLAKRGKK
jgi:AdoMet-dependent rRNA methyltransferase SPB1